VGLLPGLLLLLAGTLSAQQPAEERPIAQAKALSQAFRIAAKKVLPTVVKVKTQLHANGRAPLGEELERRLPGMPPFGGGLGSGVLIDESGIVLTNNHVLRAADEVSVELPDGREYPAEKISADEKTDLAVIRLDSEENATFPVAKLGDSRKMEIGDWVLAIGNPFELDSTVSAGIISAKGRSLGGIERGSFIQTDAAINPGNSGGPLINLDGEVIGINTAIASQSGGYQGVGFAIPTELANWVISQLIEEGKVRRAYIGVQIREVDRETAEKWDLPLKRGVQVERIFEDAPAEDSDLRRGDIILDFDGIDVNTPAQLQSVVERAEVEKPHILNVLREGEPKTLTLSLEAMPEDFGKRSSLLGSDVRFHNDAKLGIMVVELTDEMAAKYGFQDQQGVLILDVVPGSVAFRNKLKAGMLIESINNQRVASVQDYVAQRKDLLLQEGIRLELQTEEGPRVVELGPGESKD
jgi:serine protease Do